MKEFLYQINFIDTDINSKNVLLFSNVKSPKLEKPLMKSISTHLKLAFQIYIFKMNCTINFKKHCKMFTFMTKPNEIDENALDLEYLRCLKICIHGMFRNYGFQKLYFVDR